MGTAEEETGSRPETREWALRPWCQTVDERGVSKDLCTDLGRKEPTLGKEETPLCVDRIHDLAPTGLLLLRKQSRHAEHSRGDERDWDRLRDDQAARRRPL